MPKAMKRLMYDDILKLLHKSGPPQTTSQAEERHKFINAPVYELTEVANLWDGKQLHEFCDEAIEIPKRPPHDVMWAEWEFNDNLIVSGGRWTIGFLYQRLVDTTDFRARFDTSKCCDETLDHFNKATDIYTARCFRQLKGGDDGEIHNGTFYSEWLTSYSLFHDNFLRVRHVGEITDKKDDRYGVPIGFMDFTGLFTTPLMGSLWPLEMCFSLLACKNVEVITVPPSKQRIKKAKQTRHLKPATYHTIRLNRPRRLRVMQNPDDPIESSLDRPRQRFHLCRGHFKNLQSPRFKEKGWHWWPSHWRGDKSLGGGVASTRYKVQP